MKRTILILLLIIAAWQTQAAQIARVEPANWWVGMKNTQLQIMVYGQNIGKSQVALKYPGVTVKEVARTDNANYLFIYLNIAAQTKPGLVKLQFTDGAQKTTYNYPLKARTKEGAAGFSSADVLYLITPDRFANGDSKNDALEDVDVNRNDPNARHGGDLAGIEQHLDYIKDLGFTTVWLNPVQENRMPGGSYHGYAITNFYNIDPRFGTNQQFADLTKTMHNKGLKVVMDMIFNHCGSSHPWMKDLPAKVDRDILTDGWFVPSMPDLNQRNRHLATYLIQNSIWWIEYSHIDGIRQDTYPYPDYEFMQRWCREVEAEYPKFNIVGESWYGRSSASAWWQKNDKLNSHDAGLKSVMDFPLTFISNDAFGYNNNNGGEGSAMYKIYEEIAQDFMFADIGNVLTFLDNHDLDRFVRKDDPDLRRYKQALAFLLTTRGTPQIYYGTEVLMDGKKDKSDGYVRTDFPGGWAGDKENEFMASGRSAKQNEAFSYLQKLLQWRKANPAITGGKLVHYIPDNSGTYVYARITPAKTVLVVLNGTNSDKTIEMGRFKGVIKTYTQGRDVITGSTIPVTKSLTIAAKGQYVLELN